MAQMVDFALEYARKGLYVFPAHTPTPNGCSCGDRECDNIGKHPRTKNGKNDSTVDENTIRQWWKMWPAANIGIDAAKSGIVIIDIDLKNGGMETAKKVFTQEIHTPTVNSGGGGRHYYFSSGKKIPKLGQGIDVIENGAIIAPPSVHKSGAIYEWKIPLNGKIPTAPDWIKPYKIIIEQTDPTRQAVNTILDKWCDMVKNAPEGERNITLNKAAWVIGGLLHLGLSEQEGADSLYQAARLAGLKEKECISTIKSGLSAGEKKPIPLDVANNFELPEISMTEANESNDAWGEPYTLTDAKQPRQPLEFTVNGIFTKQSVNIVYGDSGSLKSFILAEMALFVARGMDWLSGDGEPYKTKESSVMWVDFDNGKRRSHERFDSLSRHWKIETDNFFYYSMPSPRLEANKSDHIAGLYTRMVMRSIGLLIVDNLGLVAGSADENSREMAEVIAGFRWLSEMTGATIIIIHHQSKPSGFQRKKGDMLRGHSAIKAGIDVALHIERDEIDGKKSPDIYITAQKERDNTIFPFAARFCHTSINQYELGEAYFTRIPFEVESKRGANRKKSEDEQEKVLDFIQSNPESSASSIFEKAGAGCRLDRIREICTGLLKAGKIIAKEGEYRGRSVIKYTLK